MFNLLGKKRKEVKESSDETAKSEVVDIYLKYSYEWKEEIPEDERDTPEHPSRPFCKRMMELNALGYLYTQADIVRITQRVGYSVWDHCGGEGCRHRWVTQRVIKKRP